MSRVLPGNIDVCAPVVSDMTQESFDWKRVLQAEAEHSIRRSRALEVAKIIDEDRKMFGLPTLEEEWEMSKHTQALADGLGVDVEVPSWQTRVPPPRTSERERDALQALVVRSLKDTDGGERLIKRFVDAFAAYEAAFYRAFAGGGPPKALTELDTLDGIVVLIGDFAGEETAQAIAGRVNAFQKALFQEGLDSRRSAAQVTDTRRTPLKDAYKRDAYANANFIHSQVMNGKALACTNTDSYIDENGNHVEEYHFVLRDVNGVPPFA